MPASSTEILHAIETGFWALPDVPGVSETGTLPGIRSRLSPVPSPLLNLVGMATFGADDAEVRIRGVMDFYQRHGLPFGWVVGPSTTPGDLSDRLGAAGFHKAVEMAGMVLRDISQPITAPPDVTVREVTDPAEAMGLAPMFAAAYGLPLDVSQVFLKLMAAPARRSRSRCYVAQAPNNGKPVAFANSTYLPDSSLILLSGAATLLEYRGQGLYTALVARRLTDALQDGKDTAVIQAARTTSAPICRKLGFDEVCNLEFFVKMPSGGEMPEH